MELIFKSGGWQGINKWDQEVTTEVGRNEEDRDTQKSSKELVSWTGNDPALWNSLGS